MGKNDKFKQLKSGGIIPSFQDMASTVLPSSNRLQNQKPRMTHQYSRPKRQRSLPSHFQLSSDLPYLDNPSIPQSMYKMTYLHCSQLDNMTR